MSSAVFFMETGAASSFDVSTPKKDEFSEELNELDVPAHPLEMGQYMESTFLSFSYASTQGEPGGCALVDTAAQHGLVGECTLLKHAALLREQYQLRVQVTNESGGTVRGVCGSEQVTKVAYVPLGISGKSGVLRVQVVPGDVPFLIPAYLLFQLGAVIDMHACLIAYTNIGAVQSMTRRSTGHVEVSICEFGKQWSVPQNYGFLKSEVWEPNPALPRGFSLELLDGALQARAMPPSLASLRAALLLCAGRAGAGVPGADHHAASSSTRSTACSSTRTSRTPGTCATTTRTRNSGIYGILDSSTQEDHDLRGPCRASAPSGGAPWAGEVSYADPSHVSDLPASGDQAWGELGVVLGEVSSVRSGGPDPQDAPGPASPLEPSAGVSEAELRDSPGAASYQGQQESDQGSGENGQPFDSWDELCGASSGDYSGDAARTPDHGHWNPSVGRLWDSSERIGDGDERPGDGCAQPLEAGGRLRTSCESSRADATMPSLPSWRSSSVSRCRREPDVLDVQRRNSGLSVPSPDSPHTPDFGHRGSPVRDVSTRGSPEPEAPRSRCFSVSSLRGHDSGNGVGGGAENGGYNPNLLNQAS